MPISTQNKIGIKPDFDQETLPLFAENKLAEYATNFRSNSNEQVIPIQSSLQKTSSVHTDEKTNRNLTQMTRNIGDGKSRNQEATPICVVATPNISAVILDDAHKTIDEGTTEFEGISAGVTPNVLRMKSDVYPGSVKIKSQKSGLLGPTM